MKKIVFISAVVLTIMSWQVKAQGTLEITIPEVESEEGQVMFLLFNQSEGFPSKVDKTYRKEEVKARKGKITHEFKDLPYGTYAISICHDENKNGEIDTNFVGFPKEKIGASNLTKLGKPSFEKSKFEITAQQQKVSLTINFVN